VIVLNTRPADQASELSRLLREAGFGVVEAPAIATVPAWDSSELERTRAALRSGAYKWVVLASPNAGRQLFNELTSSPVDVVCGTSTARALGLDRVAIALDRFSAIRALEELWTHLRPRDRVLVPRAEVGRDELIDGLRQRGVEVDAPIAYRTLPSDAARERLGEGGIEVITLCSPSAARALGSAVPSGCHVVCLGETTAAAARELGLRVDAVAQQTSMAALVDAVSASVGVRI